MAVTPLATVSDVVDRLIDPTITLTAAETARIEGLLTRMTIRVQAYCKQTFSVAQTTARFRPVDCRIKLPQTPVISVDSLGRVSPQGDSVVPFGLYIFDGISEIVLADSSIVVNAPSWWLEDDLSSSESYEIQYTHGYTAIPDDVVDVVAGAVAASFQTGTAVGIQSETIDNYSYRLADGVRPGEVWLTDDDKDVLAPYRVFRDTFTVELR